MKFAHRIFIIQSISYTLCFYQILPVSASPVLSSICFLTYAIPRQVFYLLLSICRLTIFGYFFSCTVVYKLNLNSTTVCFVYQRSTHRCGQAITTAAGRSVSLCQHRPTDPCHLVCNREDRLMVTVAFCNLAHPTTERIFYPSPQPYSILHEHCESAWSQIMVTAACDSLPPVLC